MLSNIDLEAVDLFLKTAFREIKKGNCYLVNRKVSYDNKVVTSFEALTDLGILNRKYIWDYILKLTSNDCIGISRDHDYKRDYNDDMYEFVMNVNGIETYIKLTINNRGTVCLSFHKSNRN